jgi:DNA-directed RNA polymerase specialized sigma24 family protein
MNRLAQRDSTALIELERRHRSSLYAQAYGILTDAVSAERVVRDAFAQLWFAASYVGKHSPWTLLRDMARELARAERALRGSHPTRR